MLTPIDIQNHVLKSTMGGYNKKETDDFIESIQVSYEQLYKENSDLKKKITTLSEGIQYYKQMEGTLQKTLVLAEQTASETLETSKTAAAQVEKESRAKADVMLAEAKARADALVAGAQEKADTMTTEAETKAAALKTESEETAQRVTREAEEKASSMTREAEEKASSMTREAEERARTLTREAEEKAGSMTREAEEKLRHATKEAEEKVSFLTRDAEEKSKNIMYNANERVERIMADTKADASKIINDTKADIEAQIADSNRQIADLTKVVRQLMTGYEDYKKQFTALVNRQLELLQDDKCNTNLADIEKLLESQQVTMTDQQAAAAKSFDNMTERIKEFDRPVEDTAPAGASFSSPSGLTEAAPKSEDDILAGGLSAGEGLDSSSAEPSSASVSSLNIDTPFSQVGASHGIDVSEEEAAASYKPEAAVTEEAAEPAPTPEEEPSDELKSKMSEIDAIATEALKDADAISNDPFAAVNSMLGTSYDDEDINDMSETVIDDVEIPTSLVESAEAAARSVISAADTAEPPFQSFTSDAPTANSENIKSAGAVDSEIPPTTTDELPTVQEAYDAETYVTNETYFGSADNMTYSIPDPSSEQTDIQAEKIPSAETAAQQGYDAPTSDFNKTDTQQSSEPAAAHNIPMPDFGKLDSAETPAKDIPMPDFSSLNDIAAEAMAALKTENSESAAIQNEAYYDATDNVPYTSATDEAAAEFENGISGIDPTGNGMIPPAQNELFTAPSEFDTAPPADDEYAVTGGEPEAKTAQEPAKVTPFTFYDADK